MSPHLTTLSVEEVGEIPLPTLEEVKCAAVKLKITASGPDGPNAELLKT
jgi:hypothetical protein